MTEEQKSKYVEKLCLPIRVATIILTSIILLTAIVINPITNLIVDMYLQYDLENQIPIVVRGIINVLNTFKTNLGYGIGVFSLIFVIFIFLNILWKYIAKKYINSTQIDERILEKKVKAFRNITTTILSAILVISFLIIFILFIKVIVDVYMGSFLFDAYNM